MRKTFIKIAFLSLLFLGLSCNSSQNASEKSGATNFTAPDTSKIEVSTANLKENLEYLASDELKGRNTGSPGIEKAAGFIENKFKKYGIRPYFETYRDSFETNNRTAYNIVGVIPGSDPELKKQFVLVGAHYDHLGVIAAVNNDSIANGADDNASGTVSVMELAREFAKIKDNKRSIIFALFSGEELGLKGSTHLAARLKEEDINLYTMINLEMIGVPMADKNYLAYVTGYRLSNMAEKFNEYSGKELLGFLPQAQQYNLFKRSDNYSFYQQFHVPAQTISTFDFTNYNYYHKVQDEAQNMDFEHMARLVKELIPAIYSTANSSDEEIKMEGK